MRPLLALTLLSLAGAAPARGADDLAKFAQVLIRPASSSFYIASVSMSYQPFMRHKGVYSSTYVARVFPYFFLGERGRIWIAVPDEALARVNRGESVAVTGHALSDDGDERKIDGIATPTGPREGRIKVRVFVSRRIILTYNTTYALQGPDEGPAPLTPTPAR
jgi:hypothetical protein